MESHWEDVVLSGDHVYLGVLFGRSVDALAVFAPALKKFNDRLDSYCTTLRNRSINHRILIVNVFLSSIFSYLIQFFILPYNEVINKVREAIRRAVIPFGGGAFA